MNFKIYKFFIFGFYVLHCTQNFASAFAGGLHLRSTSDLIKTCRIENLKPFVDLTEEDISYIKSGSVAADVGRFSLDLLPVSDQTEPNTSGTNSSITLFPPSDQMEFINKLKENAKLRAEKLFIFGMVLHCWQDEAVAKFSKTVFGSDHRTTYLDYARYDKWCLYDCKSEKISTISLNKKNTDFNFEPIYSVIKNIYNCVLCGLINIFQPLLVKNYYSINDFFELKNCTDLFVRTYNKLLPQDKKLDKFISSEFINESIDTVVGAHAILSSIPLIGLSDEEKLNADKAYSDMQSDLMSKIKSYNLEF